MTRQVVVHRVKVVGHAQYKCDDCGAWGAGSFVTTELHSLSESELREAQRNLSNSSLPIGWACFGSDSHKCPACIRPTWA